MTKPKERRIESPPNEDNESTDKYEEIPFVEGIPKGNVQDIKLGRLDFDNTELEFRVDHKIKDLVEDIAKNGQQFPVILRRYHGSQSLQIISGFRRARAIRELGWETIKAIIRDDIDEDMAYRISFLENEKRKNYTGVDKAHAIAKLRIKGKTDDEISDIYGIGQRQLERYKKVSTFPDILKNAITEGQIQTTHGLALMKVYDFCSDKIDLSEWIGKIADEGFSVRKLARDLNSKFGKSKKTKKYFEKKKGGGFRLYPMHFSPEKTSNEIRAKMIEKLEEALALLKTD
jgi:ParB/RepB/Spo0J family partition protein